MFRTLFISSEFPPGPGGIGTHAFNVSKTLHKRKLWITICTVSDYASSQEARAFDNNSALRVIRFKRYRRNTINWYNRIRVVCSIIINEKITHAFISGRSAIFFIPLIKLISNVKIITILHGSEFKIGILRTFSLFCLRLTDNVITVSNFTRSLIPNNIKKKAVVAHNGIDLSEWRRPKFVPSLNNFPVLLTVGSISTRKGQHNIINALPFIKKIFPNVHYHCVGEPKNEKKLLKLINNLGVNKEVSIHGIVSRPRLMNLYNKAHVNMILSERTADGEIEGYCISVLEGNIYGVPAIGSNHSGLKESIVSGINGILVNQKSPKEITEALKKIFSNYHLFFKTSIDHATLNTWDKAVIEYEKFIK